MHSYLNCSLKYETSGFIFGAKQVCGHRFWSDKVITANVPIRKMEDSIKTNGLRQILNGPSIPDILINKFENTLSSYFSAIRLFQLSWTGKHDFVPFLGARNHKSQNHAVANETADIATVYKKCAIGLLLFFVQVLRTMVAALYLTLMSEIIGNKVIFKSNCFIWGKKERTEMILPAKTL